MAEIVNLKNVRKDKARAEKKAVADANAAKFGRSKAERQLSDAERSKAARELDGKKLDD